MALSNLLLAEGSYLVSWWAPLLMTAIFTGWAWVVSSVFDKDAGRFYLPRRNWNLVHAGAGAAALAAVALTPLPWFASLPIAAGILIADLFTYFIVRNQDSRVPASAKWSFDLEKMKAASEAKKKAKAGTGSSMLFKGAKGDLAVPSKETPEYEIRVAAETLIQKMSELRGSQIDVAPLRDGSYGVSVLVDGVRQALESAAVPAARAVSIMDVFKSAAGLDLQDRRRKLVGDFKFGPAGPGALTLARVITQGSAAGMQMTLLPDPEGQVKRKFEDLGMHPNQLEDFKKLIEERKGVVLLTGPADNGRTTTFYACVRAHDAYTSNIQTVEIEQQLNLEGVRQNRFDPKQDGAEFSTTVRSILRRDPDAVGVAEMPDDNTAKEVARADHDRTRTYLSFIIEGAFPAMQAYCKAVGEQKLAAKSLYGVVSQRLVRKLCENCRAAFQPTPDMLKKLGLPPDTKQLFRKGGQVLVKDKPVLCPVCGGSGFFGQIGVFEVYTLSKADRDLLGENDLTALKASFRQRKQQSLQQSALMHAISGATSVEEVVRVTQPAGAAKPQEGQGPAPAAAPGRPPA